MQKLRIFIICLFYFQFAFSQFQIGLVPRKSPDKSISHKMGFTEIEIKYGSPSTNGRTIWGDLVPYDQVWRAGANEATSLTLSENISIENKVLPAGTYTFFIIPKKQDKWILIFNKIPKQWGAFSYSQEEDAMRIEVSPERINHQESLDFEIHQQSFEDGAISLMWEEIKLSFSFKAKYIETFKHNFEEKLPEISDPIKWVAYLQVAEHLVQRNKDLAYAEKCLNKSEAGLSKAANWDKRYYPLEYLEGRIYWTKALLFAQKQEYKKAKKIARLLTKNKGEHSFYKKENERKGIDETIKSWE